MEIKTRSLLCIGCMRMDTCHKSTEGAHCCFMGSVATQFFSLLTHSSSIGYTSSSHQSLLGHPLLSHKYVLPTWALKVTATHHYTNHFFFQTALISNSNGAHNKPPLTRTWTIVACKSLLDMYIFVVVPLREPAVGIRCSLRWFYYNTTTTKQ